MKTQFTRAAVGAMAVASLLGLQACSSPAEKAAESKADNIEDQAEMVRDNSHMVADNMEAQADTLDNRVDGRDTDAEMRMDNAAAAVRAQGENKADAMESRAEAVRNGPAK